MWNLVSNAIKFTPDRGQVRVKLERVGKYVEIMVSDTGVGIVPDFLPLVFDRFRQGDGSTTPAGRVRARTGDSAPLDGDARRQRTCQSPGPDQGATFVVRLPLIEQASDETNENCEANETYVSHMSQAPYTSDTSHAPDTVEQAPNSTGCESWRSITIRTRGLIKTILTQYGAVVETAGSTSQALTFFERPKNGSRNC